MRKLMVVLIAFVLVTAMGGIRVSKAEEELFDTKAAAELCKKGIEQLKAKNYKAAIEELEEAVSIAPDAESYYYLGYAYYFEGRAGNKESRKKSIESFEKAYDLNPNFTPVYRPAGAEEVKSAQREGVHPESSAPTATAAASHEADTPSPQPSDKEGSDGQSRQ